MRIHCPPVVALTVSLFFANGPARLHAADAGPAGGFDAAGMAAKRADDLLAQMTLDEKLLYIGGTNSFYIRAIPRLNLPAIKMSDGPMAARNDGPTPRRIRAASRWRRRGTPTWRKKSATRWAATAAPAG